MAFVFSGLLIFVAELVFQPESSRGAKNYPGVLICCQRANQDVVNLLPCGDPAVIPI